MQNRILLKGFRIHCWWKSSNSRNSIGSNSMLVFALWSLVTAAVLSAMSPKETRLTD